MSPELKREIYRAIERGGHEPAFEISRLVIGCLRDVPPDAVTFLAFPEFPPQRMRTHAPASRCVVYNMGSGVGFGS